MVSPSSPGYSYLRTVEHGHRDEVAAEHGQWPSLLVLLGLPVNWLVSAPLLQGLRVKAGSGGEYGVSFDYEDSEQLLVVVVRAMRKGDRDMLEKFSGVKSSVVDTVVDCCVVARACESTTCVVPVYNRTGEEVCLEIVQKTDCSPVEGYGTAEFRILGVCYLSELASWDLLCPHDNSGFEPAGIGDGFCYAEMLLSGFRPIVTEALGPWPTVAQLLALPSGLVRVRECLRSLGVSFLTGERVHVETGFGLSGSLDSLLAGAVYAGSAVPGTLAFKYPSAVDGVRSKSSFWRVGGGNESFPVAPLTEVGALMGMPVQDMFTAGASALGVSVIDMRGVGSRVEGVPKVYTSCVDFINMGSYQQGGFVTPPLSATDVVSGALYCEVPQLPAAYGLLHVPSQYSFMTPSGRVMGPAFCVVETGSPILMMGVERLYSLWCMVWCPVTS